jgi:hypothetical protein
MANIGTVVANFKGLAVYPKGTTLNVRSLPSTAGKILATVKSGVKAGITTGNVNKMSDGEWWQIDIGSKVYGYVRNDVATTTTPVKSTSNPTTTDAANVIANLVESDKSVWDTLARIKALITVINAKGGNTSAYDSQLSTLTNRLVARQNAIKNSNVVKWSEGIKSSYKTLLESLPNSASPYADSGMWLAGIGALPMVVIVSIVAGAGLTAAAYYIFKPKYDESKADLKISTELETALSKVDPATASKIKTQLEKQIDNAYNQGATDQKFSGAWSIIKPVGFALVGYFLLTSFVNSNKYSK